MAVKLRRGEKMVAMSPNDVTIQRVCAVFRVSATDSYLLNTISHCALSADEQGAYTQLLEDVIYEVHGTDIGQEYHASSNLSQPSRFPTGRQFPRGRVHYSSRSISSFPADFRTPSLSSKLTKASYHPQSSSKLGQAQRKKHLFKTVPLVFMTPEGRVGEEIEKAVVTVVPGVTTTTDIVDAIKKKMPDLTELHDLIVVSSQGVQLTDDEIKTVGL